MRKLAVIFLFFHLLGCSSKPIPQAYNTPKSNNKLAISVIDATFPLKISELDFKNYSHLEKLNETIVNKIENTVKNYRDTECDADSSITDKNIYINTLRLKDNLQTLYVILLKHYPTGQVNSKVLFFDNQKKEFLKSEIDFNLHACYYVEDGKLKPTNLKEDLKITIPEIERRDYDNDGIADYKFTRLFHNGTFNSLETTILSIKGSKIDTLNLTKSSTIQ